jgi:hypothetical protein
MHTIFRRERDYTQPLELVDSGREDTQDSDEMETGDEVEGRPSDISQYCDVGPPNRGDLTDGDCTSTHNIQLASAYRLNKLLTVPDGDPQLPPPSPR